MYLSLIFDKSWLLFQLNLTIISMILPYIIKELKEHLVIVLLVILRHSISVNNQLMPLFDNSLTEGITFNIIVDETKFDNNKRIKDLFSLILFLFPYNFINFIKQPKEYLYSHIDIIRSYFQLDNNKEVTLNQIFDQKSFQHDMNSILEEHTFPSSYLFGDLNDELSDENSSFLIEPIEIISKSLILQPNPSSEHIQINGNSILDSSDLFSEQFINLKYEIINNKNKNDKKDDSVQEGEDLVSKKKEIILNENLLLRGELLFETYLCQHQSQYIRKLHRDRILESSTEAERHSLYSTCKTLRNEVKVLKELMERQRVESSASQSKHITWENELNKKVKYYRELCRELKVKNEILAKEMEELKVGDNANTKILQNLEFKENCLNGLSSAIDELKSELKNKEVQIQKLTEKIIQW
ncbi:hypothetical protein K502DRAFT_141849 [Neoconidiobolus thromboides FSU 785]|nr:hypothetical protein K502DRAFT_141849 [Neoconidiobolus thromboides FSU 785]